MTSSKRNIKAPRYWPFVRGIHRSPIFAWINGYTNNHEAGDLLRYHALYDVIVMLYLNQWLMIFVIRIFNKNFVKNAFIQRNVLEVLICRTPAIVVQGEIYAMGSGRNGRHFADDIFKHILLIEKCCIPVQISMKHISNGPINNKIIIDSDNGLSPNRPHAIVWTIDDLACWCMHAPICLDDDTYLGHYWVREWIAVCSGPNQYLRNNYLILTHSDETQYHLN